MKTRLIPVLFAVTGLVAWGAALGFTEDEKPAPMSQQEVWARSAQLATPGEMHKHLDFLCGKWKVVGKVFLGAGEMPFAGESTYKWVLGNRFIEQRYEGPGMAGKMEGQGLMGYDNGKKTYQQTWAMTMGTGIKFSTGTYDAEKKTFTFTGDLLGADGLLYRSRETIQVKSANEYLATHYATEKKAGAEEKKELEMVLTRIVK